MDKMEDLVEEVLWISLTQLLTILLVSLEPTPTVLLLKRLLMVSSNSDVALLDQL